MLYNNFASFYKAFIANQIWITVAVSRLLLLFPPKLSHYLMLKFIAIWVFVLFFSLRCQPSMEQRFSSKQRALTFDVNYFTHIVLCKI